MRWIDCDCGAERIGFDRAGRISTIVPRGQIDIGMPAGTPMADIPGAKALVFRAERWSDIRAAAGMLAGGAWLAVAYLVAVVPGLVLVVVIGSWSIMRRAGR
jgi:hypothetical protein